MTVAPPAPAAFVTGASAGLGRAITEKLLREGFVVWGTARDRSRLQETFKDRAQFHPVVLDLQQAEAAVEVYRQARAETPAGFDLVVNNAGYGVFGGFVETPPEVWRRQLDAMLMTNLSLVHQQLADMTGRSRGTLVNVASMATEFPLPYMTAYNVAKAGLSALSESLLIETAGSEVTVIDFRPGDFRTGFNQAMPSSPLLEPSGRSSPRQLSAWRALERHLASAPGAERAADDLWRAIHRGRGGVVRSGNWFQVTLAPLFERLVPLAWARAVRWRYFGLSS
ncbi:SDR family NAD(P)-dependent oxidoreductase [Synoicihabitans lomoniglobus]|uniref:SDR family NAD(P)-dependent oxidoreductase n=1 Tax=Synoicihabitans lomoniglobus TaxID=2909285 RepID=A0AAF0I444_9BACT|nr:SDR family NAD(P)-dependent oxidoreductase [Opitutaceae bacterium LMO-M01]WED67422.1 SDR family NAD(P)-dependent oxidoreductase [Opitutaceae bacterium LMO-M01]